MASFDITAIAPERLALFRPGEHYRVLYVTGDDGGGGTVDAEVPFVNLAP